jgi:hypothetical protein
VRPRGELQSGLIRFDTLTTGSEIAEVEFSLDGRPILKKNRPPYSVELDLGEVPRTRTLRVVGFDAGHNEIASDEELLNASPHRFSIRLVEPRRGKKYERSLRAVARVEVPEEDALERVEFFLNEERVATLYQEPWEQPIVLPPGEPIAYVRTVATLVDGNSTEDLVFVNAPETWRGRRPARRASQRSTARPAGRRPSADFRSRRSADPHLLERAENPPVHVAVLPTSRRRWSRACPARDAALASSARY